MDQSDEMNVLLATLDIVQSICPIVEKVNKKGVFLQFDNKQINYLCETDDNGDFIIRLSEKNPSIKFIASDGQSFSIFINKK